MAHKEGPNPAKQISCAVISVGAPDAPGGRLIVDLLEGDGHKIARHITIKDAPLLLKGELAMLVESSSCQAIIMSGGTRLAARDTTYDALDKLLEKRLDGFGGVFHCLNFQENGPSAIMSRATAGVYKGRLIFAIPGAPGAVRLAVEKLILPQLVDMVGQISRKI